MSATHAVPSACENCQTALQGLYCHACGQSAHNPVRSFAHAVEEVFESFWHLDGRIFRTLRDLLVPGRLANAYLEGKRVRYIPPLRLFVVLSLITFFVAKLAVHIDSDAKDNDARNQATAQVRSDFAQARTPEEVEALRKRLIGAMTEARAQMPAQIPGARAGFDAGIANIDKQAQRRLKALGAPASAAPEAAFAASKADADLGQSTPFESPMPDFADRWVDEQSKRINNNLPRLQEDPQRLVNAFFAAVPSTLFVLVPLFALMLRVFYLLSPRGYLEHLVVALYSHAFLLLDLLAVLLLMLLGQALAPLGAWPGALIGLLQLVLVLWMSAYLLLMQRRVYRQSWLATVVKYSLIGGFYFTVVIMAAVMLAITSIARI
ncbi:MAG TPA: DUF3667 domain-containing protein [Stenotrophomonas sp.]|nr:DUF3667 domain-containing protein [Stenotrophomonas sp.]